MSKIPFQWSHDHHGNPSGNNHAFSPQTDLARKQISNPPLSPFSKRGASGGHNPLRGSCLHAGVPAFVPHGGTPHRQTFRHASVGGFLKVWMPFWLCVRGFLKDLEILNVS
jgi:hypothetical protein